MIRLYIFCQRNLSVGGPLKSPTCIYMFRGSEAITGIIICFFACRSRDINCV